MPPINEYPEFSPVENRPDLIRISYLGQRRVVSREALHERTDARCMVLHGHKDRSSVQWAGARYIVARRLLEEGRAA